MSGNSKLPWFPFYTDRFTGSWSVRQMSAEQVGVYMLLLVHEWSHGPIPSNGDKLTVICHGADVRVVRSVLRMCFEKRRGGWINKALEDVRKAQLERHKRRVAAGKKNRKPSNDGNNLSNA